MEIKSTKDYSKFKVLDGNRQLRRGHVIALMNSIERNNLLSMNPILVTKDYEVIDGQHRLMAATELQVDVYYMVVDAADITTVHTLNGIKRNWDLNDYVISYAKLGHTEYMFLLDLLKEFEGYNLTPNAVLRLAIEPNSKHVMRDIKNGELEIEDKLYFKILVKQYSDFAPLFIKWQQREFAVALRTLFAHPQYRHEDFIERLTENPGRIQPRVSAREYLALLEDLYNYNLKAPNRLRLF